MIVDQSDAPKQHHPRTFFPNGLGPEFFHKRHFWGPFCHMEALEIFQKGPLSAVARGDRTLSEARGLREKLEHLQLAHPPHAERQSMAQLPDGMMRLAQVGRIL